MTRIGATAIGFARGVAMRPIAIVALVLALATSIAPAQTRDEPLKLVKSFYAKNYDEQKMPFSERLKSLLTRAQAKSKALDEPVAGLDFSWTLGAQDADDGWEKTTRFAVKKADERQATIQVTFRLTAKGPRQDLQYLLEREKGRWVIADIVYAGPDRTSLSQLFEQGAKGE